MICVGDLKHHFIFQYSMIQYLRAFFHFILKCVHYSINLLFLKNPKKILFESGPDDYVDNSRALSDYILSQSKYDGFSVYWAFKSDSVPNVDKRIIYFNKSGVLGSIKYIYHTVTSKYLFSTHGSFAWYCKYRQNYLCMWHGTMLKKIACLQDPVKNKYYMAHCNLFTAPSVYYREIFAECFGKRLENIVVAGYPRNDLLFQSNNSKGMLRIPEGVKMVLYMPTFRSAKGSTGSESSLNVYEKGMINLVDKNDIKKWNDFLKRLNIFLVVKPHPSDKNTPCDIDLTNLRVITNEELAHYDVQLYHLLHYADALITDYSSVYCDYMLLNRPIAFVVKDMEEYKNNRGFVFDEPLNYMPGYIIKDGNDAVSFFDDVSVGADKSKELRARLANVYNDFNDGKCCQRVLEAVGL